MYHIKTLDRGESYHRYQLFRDGTSWCIVWVILVDPSKTIVIPGPKKEDKQWATREEGVFILGAYTRGYTRLQVEAFVKGEPGDRPGMTLLSQWQPRYEAPVA